MEMSDEAQDTVTPDCKLELKPYVGQTIVCNRQDEKWDVDEEGSSTKRRRRSSRCHCNAKLTLKYSIDSGSPRYVVSNFVELDNHEMVDKKHEFLGDYDSVGCTVTDIRNGKRDILQEMKGADVQMILNQMEEKKNTCDGFHYEFQQGSNGKLLSLFWCDAVLRNNYKMFGNIVSFDTTYSTNRYCMVFGPFTGKENPRCPVTFGVGFVSNEGADSFSWLLSEFVECMGFTPKLIITDQDWGMKLAIEQLLFEKHVAAMHTDRIFQQVQDEIVEAHRHCRMSHFEIEDNTDIYTIVDNHRNKGVVRHEVGTESYHCDCKLFLRRGISCCHIFWLFKNHDMKEIPETYLGTRWLKTSLLKSVYNDPSEEASSSSASHVDDKHVVATKLHSLYFHLFQRAQSNGEDIYALFDGMEELSQKLFGDTVPSVSSMSKEQRIENLYGSARPSVVSVNPPNVVSTKGSCSRSGRRN
ncbi:protein FAR-RED ELONGATED HYPOCOTYL 3-like [Salvia splendens]|uniref:protein FAR-RED ELONGATED HYPOCOTYL 3-like n=1 Tax=Salvia splendens TaxID=180675 RepID=UPI001C260FC6|nr:protein FAR-RED ELONGATED HYPOCOTYL 3-like [Salvia splendens]